VGIARRRKQNRQSIIDRFAEQYYEASNTWRTTFWLGVQTAKCPLDLWVFQEILAETRPDLIIETGTHLGGSALFLASVCALLGNGRIITVDVVDNPDRPAHPRLRYLLGSSSDEGVVSQLRREVEGVERVMVVLDSDHTADHVYAELQQLGPLVTPGCYLIVEDTIVNGNPVLPDFGPGPMEAVQRYLAEHQSEYVVDREREKLQLTFNPNGYLRRL
jgi:cephalosporin hydroxylase